MKNKFLGIICLIYASLIAYLWIFDKIKYFLAPQMQIYLQISLIFFIIIGLILIFNNKVTYKFKITDIILLLPILMIFLTGNGKLSLTFANNRISNLNNEKPKKQEIIENKNEKEEEKNNKKNEDKKEISFNKEKIDLDITDNIYNTIASYISFNKKAELLDGKTIHVKGFTLTKADYLPDNYFMIGKYAVSCCIADSNYASFFAEYSEQLENHEWYEVYGILRKGVDKEGYKMMYIDVIEIDKIDGEKEEQYVYPCYSYDDQSCQAVSNLNLVY